MKDEVVTRDEMRNAVRQGYTQIAKIGVFSTASDSDSGCGCTGGGCCGPTNFDVEALVKNIGYSDAELASVPESSNMGLSCGNPTAVAQLQLGEVVLDLGSGGGFDVFVAGSKVGSSGRVIGVDMTPDMISKARKNASIYSQGTGLSNVEFRLGEIEHLPVADASVDVVISNCVINLSPDKAQVWRDIFRVLKPNGRVAVSDLALIKALPDFVMQMVEALVGCVAGASLIGDIEEMMKTAGFESVSLISKPEYVETMTNWQDPLYRKIIEQLPAGSKASDYITSLDITASKPSKSGV